RRIEVTENGADDRVDPVLMRDRVGTPAVLVHAELEPEVEGGALPEREPGRRVLGRRNAHRRPHFGITQSHTEEGRGSVAAEIGVGGEQDKAVTATVDEIRRAADAEPVCTERGTCREVVVQGRRARDAAWPRRRAGLAAP